MKKNCYKFLACFALFALVTSCDGGNTSSILKGSSGSGTTTSTTTSTPEITKTNDDFEFAKLTYTKDDEEKALNMQTLYTNAKNQHLDSLQEQHVLVIPFGFTNYEEVQTSANIERIEKTFFGTQEEINSVGGWVSVADYYSRSSFGKSEFKGFISPSWCVYEGTDADFLAYSSGNTGIVAAKYARDWYVREYAKTNHGALGMEADGKDISWYDQNNDGYIDLIWLVYSRPQVSPSSNEANELPADSQNSWWAYVTYDSSAAGNVDNPTVKTLGWASINFLNEGYNGYDAHTFVHETGHTYGLDDYYDYNNLWSPMGAIDMMDNNIGDHCAFSKFTLGWLAPLVVDDSATITLRPTTTTGDCFIIPSPNYNGTAFDEYMMVEFMAPVGLAEKDYTNTYKYVQGFTKPGIRISHVDARVVKDISSNSEGYLTNNPEEGKQFRVSNSKGGRGGSNQTNYYPVSNSGKTDWNPYALTMIFESDVNESNNITTSKGNNASSSSLFGKYASFSLTDNSGNPSPYAKVYMPSRSNLWNKSKTMTGGTLKNQKYTIDESCTFNYKIIVKEIAKDYSTATIEVIKLK